MVGVWFVRRIVVSFVRFIGVVRVGYLVIS